MSSALTCGEALERLGASLDGELAPELAAALDGHLAGCPACRERCAGEARFEGMVARALRGSADQAGDDAAWARALQGALAPAARSAAPLPWWERFRQAPTPTQLRWVALVASLALLATFSMAGLGLRRSFQASAPTAPGAPPAPPGMAR